MLEIVFTSLLEHPDRVITTLALALALFFGYRLFNSFELKVDSSEKLTAKWSAEVQDELKSTREVVSRHSEDLGKATKAINGDFLKIKESVIDLRSDLSKESESIKKSVFELKSELHLSMQKANFISDSVTDKTGKIIIVENSIAKVLDASKRHEEMIGKIVKVVNANVNDIKKLKNSDDIR